MVSRLIKTAVLLVAFALPAFAAYEPCVQTCFTEHPTNGFCRTGKETGAALEDCTCSSLGTVFGIYVFDCIKLCPQTEQTKFIAALPDQCRDKLEKQWFEPIIFGDASVTTTGSDSSATASADSDAIIFSATGTGPATASPTDSDSDAIIFSMSGSGPAPTANAASGLGNNALKFGVLFGGVAAMAL